jgi:sec-independent protein translocase protein TatA
MNFGNIGFMEILLVLVVVLLLFGARRLPEIGASFGKSIKEFKRGLSDVKSMAESDSRMDRLPDREPTMARTEEEARPEPKRLIG